MTCPVSLLRGSAGSEGSGERQGSIRRGEEGVWDAKVCVPNRIPPMVNVGFSHDGHFGLGGGGGCLPFSYGVQPFNYLPEGGGGGNGDAIRTPPAAPSASRYPAAATGSGPGGAARAAGPLPAAAAPSAAAPARAPSECGACPAEQKSGQQAGPRGLARSVAGGREAKHGPGVNPRAQRLVHSLTCGALERSPVFSCGVQYHSSSALFCFCARDCIALCCTKKILPPSGTPGHHQSATAAGDLPTGAGILGVSWADLGVSCPIDYCPLSTNGHRLSTIRPRNASGRP